MGCHSPARRIGEPGTASSGTPAGWGRVQLRDGVEIHCRVEAVHGVTSENCWHYRFHPSKQTRVHLDRASVGTDALDDGQEQRCRRQRDRSRSLPAEEGPARSGVDAEGRSGPRARMGLLGASLGPDRLM